MSGESLAISFRSVVRVGCRRRMATSVQDEWLPRRTQVRPYRTRLTGQLTLHPSYGCTRLQMHRAWFDKLTMRKDEDCRKPSSAIFPIGLVTKSLASWCACRTTHHASAKASIVPPNRFPNRSLSLMSHKFRIAGSASDCRLAPTMCSLIPLTPIVPHDIDWFHQ